MSLDPNDSIDRYVARSLAARRKQGLPDGIEDETTLTALAELLSPRARLHND